MEAAGAAVPLEQFSQEGAEMFAVIRIQFQ